MNFNIDQKIFDDYPNLKIGIILVKNMNNSKRVSSVEGLLRGISAQRGREFAEKDIHEDPMIRAWDYAYGKFGINPRKYRCSIAGLLKTVKEGKEIPRINTLVDLYNYYSLKFLLPIGGEDLDWLYGDLNLTYTKGGEAFRPLESIEIQKAKEGEAAYIDSGGITCRYWNHRVCERTKFTEKTINAAIIVEDMSKMHLDQFGNNLREIQNGIYKYIGGQIESYILTEETPYMDLGIEGRQNADDSKVPRQEKAHFLELERLKNKAKE
ncbi:hypothetical protein GF366_01575 [Candidatus Peregrinibacteria bacterium]|nr:hypothetical protein [Candidatus Peregrinibacteria bacterium]